MGLKDETETKEDDGLKEKLMKIIIGLRQEARDNKDFKTSDKIRDELKKAGITLKDRKDGVDWEIE
jgi:cysteinyl-tRNA synthetase